MRQFLGVLAVAPILCLSGCNDGAETEISVVNYAIGKESGEYGKAATVGCEIQIKVVNNASTTLNHLSFHLVADGKGSSQVALWLTEGASQEVYPVFKEKVPLFDLNVFNRCKQLPERVDIVIDECLRDEKPCPLESISFTRKSK